LSPEKGAAEAIDIALAAGIRIDVYGDTYDAEYAREQIDPRRNAPGVTVHRGVPRASLWVAMARAAVVVCPARWDEPFGMAAAEAQACGTPVVAFKRGGLGEMIADGVTGFLVAPDDAGQPRQRPEDNQSRARRAAATAESHLDLERVWTLTSSSTGESSVPVSGRQPVGDGHWLAGGWRGHGATESELHRQDHCCAHHVVLAARDDARRRQTHPRQQARPRLRQRT
jgi:hypothetical protein